MNYIRVIIPAFNEEKSVGKVIDAIPKDIVNEVIVVNNGSNDNTFEVAKSHGATVLSEEKKGYGNACLKGIEYIKSLKDPTNVLVFLDADYSDHPEELPKLIQPILEEDYQMVIGSRTLGKKEVGSITPQQIFGNWLATKLLRLFYGVKFTDLGPFRAIRWDSLQQLQMVDRNYGWTVEMQIKAAQKKLKYKEVPVSYRQRIGQSKVSGTVKGTIMAGYKILWLLFKYAI